MAVCTLRPETRDAAYVITYDDDRAAGEANVRVAFITPQGHLRIAFHRGGFASMRRRIGPPPASPTSSRTSWPTSSRPSVVVSSGMDCVPLHARSTTCRSSSSAPVIGPISPSPSPRSWPDTSRRSPIVLWWSPMSKERHRRSETGITLPNWSKRRVTGRRWSSGVCSACGAWRHFESLERAVAFSEVRRAVIQTGRDARAAAVRRRLSCTSRVAAGLEVRPDGGYACRRRSTHGSPVGTTGVIRRAGRNGRDRGRAGGGPWIMIPADLYQEVWLRPLSVDELVSRMPPTPAAAASA